MSINRLAYTTIENSAILLPNEVWDTLNVDFLLPLPNGKYVFAIMDKQSTINHLLLLPPLLQQRKYFMSYLVNMVTIYLNGPPFKLKEIKDYFSKHAITHHRVTNGEIEPFMKPMRSFNQHM